MSNSTRYESFRRRCFYKRDAVEGGSAGITSSSSCRALPQHTETCIPRSELPHFGARSLSDRTFGPGPEASTPPSGLPQPKIQRTRRRTSEPQPRPCSVRMTECIINDASPGADHSVTPQRDPQQQPPRPHAPPVRRPVPPLQSTHRLALGRSHRRAVVFVDPGRGNEKDAKHERKERQRIVF